MGTIQLPGDKSISHRAIMLASLAKGETHIKNFLMSEDCLNTVKAFRQMGIKIEGRMGNFIVYGKGLWGLTKPMDIIDVGNSGTTARLLTGILSSQRFDTVITGDESLRQRPMGRIIEPLSRMNARISGSGFNGELVPLFISGDKAMLNPITYSMPIASAQVKSAILLAGLFAKGNTTVIEPLPTRDHTERLMAYMDVPIIKEGLTTTISGPAEPIGGRQILIPVDFSSAAFFIVAATLVEGSEITISHVGINPTRIGAMDVLKEMGAEIELLNITSLCGEDIADIKVKHSKLKGVKIDKERIPQLIDEIPILAVAACFAEGITEIRGAEELRVKETDRIKALCTELSRLGGKITEFPDGMLINGGAKLKGGIEVSSYGDHRIAMSLIIAGLMLEDKLIIDNTKCILTSFPDFMEILK